MREGTSVFDLFLPGIVAGMILAGVLLLVAGEFLPDTFAKLFPRETVLLLAVAIVTASVIGLVSLLLPPREEDKHQKDASPKLPSGGPDVP